MNRQCPRMTATSMVTMSKARVAARVSARMMALMLAGLLAVLPGQRPAEADVASEARLAIPEEGVIQVAFVLSPGATMIDFTGPWEVFQDVHLLDTSAAEITPFRLFVVAETLAPITASGGMRILPDYTFANAPTPHVIVVPAQGGSPGLVPWLVETGPRARLVMSVCAGAYWLARSGLLDGRLATTHHGAYDSLEREFPAIEVRRGVRWVEGRQVASAGGLTSGIDLALRVVARFFGEDTAARTASYMEHASSGWRSSEGVWDPTTVEEAKKAAAQRRKAARPAVALQGLDPVLLSRGIEQVGRSELVVETERYRYVFASEENLEAYRSAPDRYSIQFDGACAGMPGSSAGSGDPDRFLVHEGRIYVFASEDCRERFSRNPAGFVDR